MHALSKFAVGAAGIAALLAASAASASVFVATYTGTVYDSHDYTGVFGGAGSSLDGDAFTAKYVYDTAVGYRYTPGNWDQIYGGSSYGVPSPVNATISINGITQVIAGNYSGEAYAQSGKLSEYVEDHNLSNTRNALFNEAFPSGGGPNLELTVPLTGATGDGYFQFVNYDPITGVYTTDSIGQFTNETVQVQTVVPEPSSWALMLIGFSGLGAALRSNRRTATAAV